jgi:hypothetical protein
MALKPLTSSRSRNDLNVFLKIDPESCYPIRLMRSEYGGLPKHPRQTPWSELSLLSRPPPKRASHYRDILKNTALKWKPFEISIVALFVSQSRTSKEMNHVGLDLRSESLVRIRRELALTITPLDESFIKERPMISGRTIYTIRSALLTAVLRKLRKEYLGKPREKSAQLRGFLPSKRSA